MMQSSLTGLTIAFMVLLLSLSTWVQAEVAVRTLLNHGNSVEGATCSNSEWSKIYASVIGEEQPDRRNLREGKSRNLRTSYAVPSYCKAKCSGFASGYCMLVWRACAGYIPVDDRRLAENEMIGPIDSSSSQHETACRSRITTINSALDSLSPSLSPECQSVVSASRDFTCYEDTDLDILGFRLWSADTDFVIDEDFSLENEEICSSSEKLNFEAVTGALVDKVTFSVISNDGFTSSNTETGGPFLSFGDDDGDIKGKRLRVGSYTLVATPDGDANKRQVVSFEVVSC